MIGSNYHHRNVLAFARLVAAALVVALSASPVALCAGWQFSPEARMACCAKGIACPMHSSEDDGGTTKSVTQSEADSCCAAGEQDDATPTAKLLAAVPAIAIATPSILLPPQADTRPRSLTLAISNHGPTVSRHLLLSVFIV